MAVDNEPLLEHALTFALYQQADKAALFALLENPSLRVQKAALALLDQAPHRALSPEAVLRRVVSPDESLRRAAIAIMQKHPEWGSRAEPLIRDMLGKSEPSSLENSALQDLLLAYQSNPSVQALAAGVIVNTNAPSSRRVLLLDSVAKSSVAPLPAAWLDAVRDAVRSENFDVCLHAIRAIEARRINTVDVILMDLATRTNLMAEVRLTAFRAALPRQPQLSPTTYELLLRQIEPSSAPGARLAAAELLGRARWADPENDPGALVALLRGNHFISTSTLLPLLLQSQGKGWAETLKHLSEAIEGGWQPSDKELQMIRSRMSTEANGDLARLTSRLEQRAAGQREQVENYIELLAGGNRVRGQKWFSEKAGCIACHRVGGAGGVLGPDLTRIGAIRSGRDLVESMILPSASFAQGYETFSVILRNGEELTGVRVRQDDEGFVLREASGREVRLEPGQVQSAERGKVSLMPEGLLASMTREEIRDLLAYLQSLK
jgi:putative heme-binding domain-containing protein